MLKATIASVLALTAALSVAGCNGKPQEAAKPAAAPAAAPAADAQMPAGMNHPPAKPAAPIEIGTIAKAEKTVAEVFEQKDQLSGQKLSVRGQVVKTNSGIMGKDWVHVRDGSGAEGTNDLTVTVPATGAPLPNVGDTVLVTGTVGINRDFGMGYQYPAILEDAQVKVEAPAKK